MKKKNQKYTVVRNSDGQVLGDNHTYTQTAQYRNNKIQYSVFPTDAVVKEIKD